MANRGAAQVGVRFGGGKFNQARGVAADGRPYADPLMLSWALADAAELMQRIDRAPGVTYAALVPNTRFEFGRPIADVRGESSIVSFFAPARPGTVFAEGWAIKHGRRTAFYEGALKDANGTLLGSATVGSTGLFSISLTPPQANAQLLTVTQSDASNNISAPVAVTAPDLTPPAEPANLLLASNGVQLSGTAEAGSTVTVRDSAGNVLGSVVAASNGTFQVTLNSVQANGQTLQVTATDAAGNVSQPGNFTAPDTTPPAAVANLAVAANGASLAGTGEAGADDDYIEIEFPRCVLHVPPDPWSACTMPGRRDVGMARR